MGGAGGIGVRHVRAGGVGAPRAGGRGQALPLTAVQGVVRVWVVEEIDQAVDDGVDVEDGLPVLAQNVEADVALRVDVRVVDLSARARARIGREGGGGVRMRCCAKGGASPRGRGGSPACHSAPSAARAGTVAGS